MPLLGTLFKLKESWLMWSLESYWNLWGFQMFVAPIRVNRWLWQGKRTFIGLYIYILFEDPCHDGRHHDNDCHLYSGVISAATIIIIIIIIIMPPAPPWLQLDIDFHAMVNFEEQQKYKQQHPYGSKYLLRRYFTTQIVRFPCIPSSRSLDP